MSLVNVSRFFSRLGKLGLRLLVPFLLVGFASVIGAASSVLSSVSIQRQAAADLQDEVAAVAVARIDAFIEDIRADLKQGADQLGAVAGDDEPAQLAILRELNRANPALFELALINDRGMETVKLTGRLPVPPEQLTDQAGLEKFLGPINGEEYVGQVYISLYDLPFVSIAVPVFDERGNPSQVLAAEVDVSQIWNEIAKITETRPDYTVYVVDQAGHLIAFKDTNRTRALPDLTDAASGVAGVRAFVKGDFQPQEYQGISDQAGLATQVIGTRALIPSTGWGVIVERPLIQAYRTTNLFILQSAGLILLSILIIAAVGWYIRRSIIQPLARLRTGAAKLGAGNLDHRIKISTNDELEDLATEFNTMAANLQASQNTLAATARENEALAREAQARVREISSLVEAGRAITSLDLGRVLNTLAKEAARAVVARSCLIYVLDQRQQLLLPQAQWHASEVNYEPPPRRLGQGLVGWVAQEARLLRINRVSDDDRFADVDRALPYEKVLARPLRIGERVVGVLLVADKQEGLAFLPQDEQLLRAFADQAAIAVENAELFQEQQRRADELTLVNQINQTIMASLDLETTIDAILRNVQNLLDYRSAEINLWDEPSQTLTAHVVGATAYTLAAGSHYTRDEGYTGWIARNLQSLLIPDIETCTEIKPKGDLIAVGYRSYVGVPLVADQEFLGTMELCHAEKDAYHENDLATLELLANQAAIAIQHAALYQEARTRADAQARLAHITAIASTTLDLNELLERTMAETARAVGAESGVVLLLDMDKTHMYAHPAGAVNLDPQYIAALSIETQDPSFEQSIVNGGQTFISDNAATDPRIIDVYRPAIEELGLTTVLGVPLKTLDENIGELYVLNKPAPFTEDDRQFVTSIAPLLATAIQNAYLFDSTQRNLHELSIIYETAADLSSTLSVDEVLANLARRMIDALPVDDCAISRYTEELDILETIYETERARASDNGSGVYPLADYPKSGQVLQTRQPLIIRSDDPEADPREVALLNQWNYGAVILLPLVIRDEPIGLVELYADEPRNFSREEISLAQTLTNQAAIALQNAQLFSLTDEALHKRIKELSGLQRVSQQLNRTLVMDDTLNSVLEEAIRATGADYGNVSLHQPDSGQLVARVGLGWPEETFRNVLGESFTDRMGVVGRVLRSGEPALLDDVEQDPDYVRTAPDACSEIAVPIHYAGSIVGVINLESKQRKAFNRDQLRYLEALANQAALAIGNAQAFEEQRQERDLASRRANQLARIAEISRGFRTDQPLEAILEDIAYAIQETVDFNIVLFSVVEGEFLRRSAAAGVPIADFERVREMMVPLETLERWLKKEFQISQSYFIPADRENPEAEAKRVRAGWRLEDSLLTPLYGSEGQIIGMLSVDDPIDGQRPTRRRVETLEIFANQAATAIENANLYQEAARRASQLRLSSQIGRRISAILDPDELLGEVVDLIRDAFGYDRVHIYGVEQRSRELILRSESSEIGYDLKAVDRRLKPGQDGLVCWVAANGEPKLVNDVDNDPQFDPNTYLPETKAEVTVPLRIGEEVWGVLDAHSYQPHNFSHDDVAILQALADQLAIALENSRLFDDSLRRGHLSAALGQAGLSLISSLNPQEITDLVCQEALKAFEVHSVFLWLVEEEGLVGAAGRGRNAESFIGMKLPLADESILGVRVVQHRRAEFVNGVDFTADTISPVLTERFEAQAVLGAPLILGERALGALMFIDCEDPARFDAQDSASATLFANQSAAAIENARLFEALERQVHQLATLTKVSSAVQQTLDLDEVLNLVLQAVFDMIGNDQGFIMLHDTPTGTLKLAKTKNIPDIMMDLFNQSRISAASEPFARVIESGQIVEENGSMPIDTTQVNFAAGAEKVTYIPLKTEDAVIGILAIEDILTEDTTRNLVKTLADLAAIAINKTLLFTERERRIKELAVLNKTGQAINATRELKPLLEIIHRQVGQIMNADNFYVALYDRERDVVSFPYHVDSQNEVWEARKAGNGLTEYVIQTRKPLLLSGDVRQAMAERDIEEIGEVCESWLGVPMTVGKEVLGVIAVQSYDPAEASRYTENNLNILQTMATQAAVAIDNIHLLDTTRSRADEMQQLYDLGVMISSTLDVNKVLQSVIEEALNLTKAHLASIYLWDEETRRYLIEGAADTPEHKLYLPLAQPRPNGLTAQVMKSGEPQIIPITSEDPRVSPLALSAGIQSTVVVPIMVQGDAAGVIFVSNLTPRQFGEHDVRLLSFVANQASVAIRNAQLVQRLNRFTEELERRVEERTEALARTLDDLTIERDRVRTLYSITKELSTSLDLDRVLMEALSLINRAVGVSYGSILMLDSSTGYLIYRAALNRPKPIPRGGIPTRYKLGVGLAGKVMENREPEIVYDVTEDPSWIPAHGEPEDRRAALVVPLNAGDDVLGVLMLYHPRPGYFNEEHLKLVSAAGAQVATAINNAGLYNLITEQAARLGNLLRSVQAEAAKNQAIVQGITDGVIVLDAEQKVVLINPAAGQLLGLDAKAVADQPLSKILGQPVSEIDQRLVQHLCEFITSVAMKVHESNQPLETRLEADKKVIAVSVAPVALTPGAESSLIAVLRDMSREAEVERLKNEFISTVSHELRTPMTSIKGYTDLLASGKVGDLSDTQLKFVKVVKANADRLTALVNDILDISHVEAGKIRLEFQSLNMVELIQDVATSFGAQMVEKNISLVLDLPDELPPVLADQTRLTQILVNLISNAWKYTLPEGVVTVRARADNRFVQVDVSDTGIGLSEADLERIFDRFYRVERREVLLVDGTGLGLSIVRMFVEMLGGQIWAEAELDAGSTFSFTIPRVIEEATEAEETGQAAPSSRKKRIMVVEDDGDIARLLRSQLQEEGYEVITVATGQEALDLARNEQLDLITLDILLPDIEGLEVLSQLKADPSTRQVPVIVISIVPDTIQDSFALGAAEYVTKPFEVEQVLEGVQRLLADQEEFSDLRRILVVDQEQGWIDWLREGLAAEGFEVQGANSGHDALKLAQASRPDLILLDIKTPDMAGGELIRHLRNQESMAGVPIIITNSSLDKENGKIQMLGLETHLVLSKPFSIEALVAEIKRIEQNLAESRES
ncbi:MAG: GAF domain-containing protein [Anaerolineae bacterium]